MGYRKLAETHGVEYSVLAKRAAKEKWTEARKEFAIKRTSKTLDKISAKEAARAAKVFSVADKLLGKIERMASSDASLTSKDIRALTAAVRDLKEIHGVKTALEPESTICAGRPRRRTPGRSPSPWSWAKSWRNTAYEEAG